MRNSTIPLIKRLKQYKETGQPVLKAVAPEIDSEDAEIESEEALNENKPKFKYPEKIKIRKRKRAFEVWKDFDFKEQKPGSKNKAAPKNPPAKKKAASKKSVSKSKKK